MYLYYLHVEITGSDKLSLLTFYAFNWHSCEKHWGEESELVGIHKNVGKL